MTKNILFLFLIVSSQIFAQNIPQLVTTPEKSRENVEAYINKANYEDQKELVSCFFNAKHEEYTSYRVILKTTGQNDLKIQIGRNRTRSDISSGISSRSQYFDEHFQTTKHAQDYNDFLQNFVERFAERGNSHLMLNACTYDKAKWTQSIDTHNETDISIVFDATSRERTTAGKFFAYIGVSLSEFTNLTSQTYRFLVAGDNLWDRLTLVYMTNPFQIAAAAAFSEDLSGSITIGNDEYKFTSCKSSEVLSHYTD